MSATVCSPWCSDADLALASSEVAIEPQVSERARLLSSEVLFNLTRRRWPGECRDSFAPLCGTGTCSSQVVGAGHVLPMPYGDDYIWWPDPSWYDLGWTWLALPVWNATAVESFTVNGMPIDPGSYELRDGHWVVRTDGQGWPCDDIANDVVVSYRYGTLPPPGGVAAAAALGTQFAIAWTPASKLECRLPGNVASIVRQGVTYTFDLARRLIEAGQTGLPEVDLWVSAINYGDTNQRARVGVPGPRRTSRAP